MKGVQVSSLLLVKFTAPFGVVQSMVECQARLVAGFAIDVFLYLKRVVEQRSHPFCSLMLSFLPPWPLELCGLFMYDDCFS